MNPLIVPVFYAKNSRRIASLPSDPGQGPRPVFIRRIHSECEPFPSCRAPCTRQTLMTKTHQVPPWWRVCRFHPTLTVSQGRPSPRLVTSPSHPLPGSFTTSSGLGFRCMHRLVDSRSHRFSNMQSARLAPGPTCLVSHACTYQVPPWSLAVSASQVSQQLLRDHRRRSPCLAIAYAYPFGFSPARFQSR